MVLFNNIPYKHMHLTSKVNLTKRFSEKYKRMRLTTRLYGMPETDPYNYHLSLCTKMFTIFHVLAK